MCIIIILHLSKQHQATQTPFPVTGDRVLQYILLSAVRTETRKDNTMRSWPSLTGSWAEMPVLAWKKSPSGLPHPRRTTAIAYRQRFFLHAGSPLARLASLPKSNSSAVDPMVSGLGLTRPSYEAIGLSRGALLCIPSMRLENDSHKLIVSSRMYGRLQVCLQGVQHRQQLALE